MCDTGQYVTAGVVYVNGQVVSISRCTVCREHVGEAVDLDDIRMLSGSTQTDESEPETAGGDQDGPDTADDHDGLIG